VVVLAEFTLIRGFPSYTTEVASHCKMSFKSKQFSQNLALLYSFTFSCFGDKYLPNLPKELLYRYKQTQALAMFPILTL